MHSIRHYFKISLTISSLLIGILFSSPVFCENQKKPIHGLSKEELDIAAISARIRQFNPELILEVKRGTDALNQFAFTEAIDHFSNAVEIAPYDPMAYILLIKTFIILNQEDEAYRVLEKAGRNYTDSSAIIAELSRSLNEDLPPITTPPLPLVSIAQFKDNKQCAISMIFDDGEISVPQIALPLLEEYGFRVTVSINPGVTEEDLSNPYRGNWDNWRKAKAYGHEIANHGMNHRVLPHLNPQQIQAEVNDSLEIMNEKLGEKPLTFIFPNDETTPEITHNVVQSHIAVRDHDFLTQVYDRILIPVYGGAHFPAQIGLLTDIAIKRHLWLIPEYHGISHPSIKKSYKPVTDQFLKVRLDYLKKNSDKIWIERFIDVFKYLKEQKETRVDIKQSKKGKVLFSLTNTLDQTIYSYPVTVIVNTAPSRPRQAKAIDLSNKKTIPVKIDGEKIYLDVVPANNTVEVEWK